jgi:glutathione S-transferase
MASGATAKVEIYGMAISANVIPAVLFCRDKKCGDFVNKDMMKGELRTPDMLAKNPWGQMPSMSDGNFDLAESRAILRYLANAYDIGSYGGMDAQERGNIDWALDWQATNFIQNYKDIWYPVAGFGPEPADRAAANKKATENLELFEKKFLTGTLIGGSSLNIADYAIGTWLWYLNHKQIKTKTGFELSARCQKYVGDWSAALSSESKEFLKIGAGFLDSKA